MKTTLITGVGRGIGKALAQKFLAEGYAVIGATQTGTADYSHANLQIVQLDLASADSIRACTEDIARTLAAAGTKLDILINNAGALFDEDETHVVIDKLRRTLEVNLIGTIDWTEHMIPSLDASAHIVNMSSSAGALGAKSETEVEFANSSHFPYHYPAYKISKCALNMYTRTLAGRFVYEKAGITVSSVHPGWVKTDMGGPEAEVTPEEAATNIFKLAI